jgi:hypothetical protein
MDHIKIDGGIYYLDDYMSYLKLNRHRFPTNAYSFASAPWHYDIQSNKCPHDSWLNTFLIKENASGERKQIREIEIVGEFLGSFHDSILTITYRKVVGYNLRLLQDNEYITGRVWHGDWLIDEIALSKGGVRHNLLFSSGGGWTIECADIEAEWRLIDFSH